MDEYPPDVLDDLITERFPRPSPKERKPPPAPVLTGPRRLSRDEQALRDANQAVAAEREAERRKRKPLP